MYYHFYGHQHEAPLDRRARSAGRWSRDARFARVVRRADDALLFQSAAAQAGVAGADAGGRLWAQRVPDQDVHVHTCRPG